MSIFEDGKIYKLVSDRTDKIYVGSTYLTLDKRLYNHTKTYEYYKNKRGLSSFILLKNNDCRIELIEDYPCGNRTELLQREAYWIEKLKDKCVNKNRPYITDEQFKELKKRLNKYHNDKNRVINKEYYVNYLKKYRSNIPKVMCEYCGTEDNKYNMVRHKNTKKHLAHVKFAEKCYKK